MNCVTFIFFPMLVKCILVIFCESVREEKVFDCVLNVSVNSGTWILFVEGSSPKEFYINIIPPIMEGRCDIQNLSFPVVCNSDVILRT
ncbi:hypothetical protein XELAEV_18032807mg [Xenopus laevis]|uniref:Secreted protein n=1 Tax=Xenopus laevis TaxID=8355 RepID=A0A974CIK2_XENLA|nr:hypothetical protein XELAEV_18032807mg [Xenopus laevis]